jgi:hypothetical protein
MMLGGLCSKHQWSKQGGCGVISGGRGLREQFSVSIEVTDDGDMIAVHILPGRIL